MKLTSFIRLGRIGRIALVVTLAAPGCSSLLTKTSASSYLIMTSLEASTGREPDKLSSTLSSDVLTSVKVEQTRVPTIFADGLVASLALAMKSPAADGTATAPSTANFITITHYHVKFVRSDGRNVEGVDVPYAFDGAATVTVGESAVKIAVTLVRNQAKSEAPLKALVGSSVSISTVAEVTFYGKDQTGKEVTVVGLISVNFADWGDPA